MISVVIPTYNREKVIARSIESVLKQEDIEIEVIVVDDCSTDNTEQVVKKINDSRIKFYKLDSNFGACIARNTGIKLSTGEYIAFQDSDDVWHPNKLKIQLSEMIKNNAKVSFCNFIKINEKLKKQNEFPTDVKDGYIEFETFLEKSIVSTQCIVAKRECFDDICFDPIMPRLQDWDLVLALSKKYRILHINQALVDMYVQEDSISSNNLKGIEALNILWKKYQTEIQSNCDLEAKWLIYLGNYKLASGLNPVSEYRKVLNISFNKKIMYKYILAKLGLINIIYKKTGRI